MAKERIVIHLDSRLVALLGDDRSGNIKEAIIQLYNVDRTMLTPNITEYAGGAKPLTSVPASQIKIHQHTAPPPQQRVDGFTVSDAPVKPTQPRAKLTRDNYEYKRNQLLNHPQMLAQWDSENELDESL